MIDHALASVPRVTHPNWIRYENDSELHKWTMEKGLPDPWDELLEALAAIPVDAITGITGLRCDLARRGAGCHVMLPGGYLAPHLDYALHPSGLERRANLILFLNGGTLDLCDLHGNVAKAVDASAGTAVIFECGETSYHGVSRLAKTASPRVTAASYYLANPRPGTIRRRATFLPTR